MDDSHGELAAHLIELVPAHVLCLVRRIGVCARTNAELVVGYVLHPLGDVQVGASDVRRNIAAYECISKLRCR
jgi:hypothetical protein